MIELCGLTKRFGGETAVDHLSLTIYDGELFGLLGPNGAGKRIAFITLGDPTVYSTFSYLEKRIRADGFRTEYVSGVTSFCAAAAALRVPLAEWQEPVHIIPAVHKRPKELLYPGNCVLMKSGRRMQEVKEYLREQDRAVWMGVNVGMPGETLYRSLEEIPDEAGYFALIIAKEAPEEDRQ